MKVEPYLFFNGRANEAIEFYQKAVGAQLTFVMRNKDSPEPLDPAMSPPGSENNVMHANLTIGSTQLMVSDGMPGTPAVFKGFSLSTTVADEATARKYFAALSEGGKVTMPIGKTFFSPCFGMLEDKFGVGWMLLVDDGNRPSS